MYLTATLCNKYLYIFTLIFFVNFYSCCEIVVTCFIFVTLMLFWLYKDFLHAIDNQTQWIFTHYIKMHKYTVESRLY